MATSYPLTFRLAQAIGLSGAAWLSGMFSIPADKCSKTKTIGLNTSQVDQYVQPSHAHPLITGTIASISNITIPALLQSHREDKVPANTLAKQWKRLYGVGKARAPPIAATVAASFVYLAWSVRSGPPLFRKSPYSRSGIYLVAAILTVGIVPFTMVVMAPTNGVLSKMTESDGQLDDGEVVELVERWTVLNRIRSLFPLVGGLCAIAASLL